MNTITKTFLSQLIPIGIFLLAFSYFLRVQAQEPSDIATASTSAERLENREDQAQEQATLSTERQASTSERIIERQEIRNERQAALQEVRQKRVLNLAANISNRMDAAINRLYDIVARLEQRVAKLKTAGVDTVAAETKIREASQALAEARATISTIDTLVYDATTSTEPQKNWAAVRFTYQAASQLTRASHQSLREAIALLKTAVSDADLQRSAAVTDTASTTE